MACMRAEKGVTHSVNSPGFVLKVTPAVYSEGQRTEYCFEKKVEADEAAERLIPYVVTFFSFASVLRLSLCSSSS